MPRTRTAPSLSVLALAGAILFIAILLVLVAVLAGSGNSTGHSPVHCTKAPALGASADAHPCAPRTSASIPGWGSTTRTPQPAGPARKELPRKVPAPMPKATAAPKAPAAPKTRR